MDDTTTNLLILLAVGVALTVASFIEDWKEERALRKREDREERRRASIDRVLGMGLDIADEGSYRCPMCGRLVPIDEGCEACAARLRFAGSAKISKISEN